MLIASDIHQSIQEALDDHPGDLPWAAPDEAAHLTRALPDFDWPIFRHLIQSTRERFVNWHDNDARDSRVGLPRASSPLQRPHPTDLLTWGKTYLPDHFRKPPSTMHQWMARHLDDMPNDRNRKLNVLGPRGGAKSTLATLAYPLREALYNREPYIWIISDTAHQARAHLDNLKAELLDNPLLQRDYPNATGRGPVWRANKIVLRNGVTIEAFGTGQRIRGRRARANRPTLLICDDLQNDQHMESTIQRSHTRTWFHGTLLKAGTPQTNVVNLATALHREALATELDQTPGWTSRIFRSIDPWPFNTSLWEEWEQIYQRKGDWLPLCEAPEGPARQKVPVPFSRPTPENPRPSPLSPPPIRLHQKPPIPIPRRATGVPPVPQLRTLTSIP